MTKKQIKKLIRLNIQKDIKIVNDVYDYFYERRGGMMQRVHVWDFVKELNKRLRKRLKEEEKQKHENKRTRI